jgi:hypothetical protein
MFRVGDLVRVASGVGVGADLAVVAVGAGLRLRPRLRVLWAGSTFEVDASTVELVQRAARV